MMNTIINKPFTNEWNEGELPREKIRLQIFSEPCSCDLIIDKLMSLKGPVDIYCWYEGSKCLPKLGADFLKTYLFEPLYQLKKDAKIYLYSLKAWDFQRRSNLSNLPPSTPLGDAINRINSTAIECIYSSSFFQYCASISKGNNLYEWINDELPKKEWLFDLSKKQKKKGVTIDKFYKNQSSIFNCIKDYDLSSAYSSMQYIEGYYLIQKSIRNALLNRQTKIEIAFVLPNDESKYYVDLPQDINNMLLADFGGELSGIEVNISFLFFKYGNSLTSRHYIDKPKTALKVTPEEIQSYFEYLS